ncbi:hypothetical protein LTR36_007973 [Oleoguttula mirabilis]|uniref:GST N-terminal domain-containing protein n=1 Tax=Oleoguttula mirabilis TaxID=1507867 RepID=A0AAV9J9L9_9PEZI|nr:hypothetical protein LTR36_007973 [Oleoguttula mirabilis]
MSTRLALNYKGLPYKTEWIEYPDIAPKFKSFGIPSHAPGTSNYEYSVPAIRISGGSYIMESLAIAKALEELQPEPSLHLDNGYTDRVQAVAQKILGALAPIGMPRIPPRLLNPTSERYFRETREKRFGMPLQELAKSDRAGENAWKAAEAPLQELKGILHEHEDGPYVMGERVSFADFILAGLWRFVQILDEGGDLFERGMKIDESIPKHYEACKKWLERDDH